MIKALRKILGWQSDGKWEIIHEARGNHPDSAFVLLSSLQSKGIRCRMRTIGPTQYKYTRSARVTHRVEVIKEDMARARPILTETLRKSGP